MTDKLMNSEISTAVLVILIAIQLVNLYITGRTYFRNRRKRLDAIKKENTF